MTETSVLATIVRWARSEPLAVLTTRSALGVRSRLVHPIWRHGSEGCFILTDGTSPKAEELNDCSGVTLAYRWDSCWTLIEAVATIDDLPMRVEECLADVSARPEPEGYEPSDFWSESTLPRVVVADLEVQAVEMSCFESGQLEVTRWKRMEQLRADG